MSQENLKKKSFLIKQKPTGRSELTYSEMKKSFLTKKKTQRVVNGTISRRNGRNESREIELSAYQFAIP